MRELRDGGGFTAGDHQAVDVGQFSGVANLDRGGAGCFQRERVLAEVPLQREDARFHGSPSR
jgi:hypothetical protein